MIRLVSALVLAAFATVAVSVPADAKRHKKSSQPKYKYSSLITYGQKHSPRPAFAGIRDRSVPAFQGRRADGRSFFEDQASRSSSQ